MTVPPPEPTPEEVLRQMNPVAAGDIIAAVRLYFVAQGMAVDAAALAAAANPAHVAAAKRLLAGREDDDLLAYELRRLDAVAGLAYARCLKGERAMDTKTLTPQAKAAEAYRARWDGKDKDGVMKSVRRNVASLIEGGQIDPAQLDKGGTVVILPAHDMHWDLGHDDR